MPYTAKPHEPSSPETSFSNDKNKDPDVEIDTDAPISIIWQQTQSPANAVLSRMLNDANGMFIFFNL